MKSPFEIRGINVCESLSRHSDGQVRRLLDRLVDWRMNTLIVHPAYGYRRHNQTIRAHCRAHGITLIHYIYTTLEFAAEASPDLFARTEDGLPHRERLECETRLCPSNPDAMQLFREGARRYLAEQVEPHDHILLATPDGTHLCRCPDCRKLNAVEQWQPMLEIAVDEIQRSGKALTTYFLAYIGRFALPKDMSVFQHIDAVMFDTHLRYRWKPIGSGHPMGPLEQGEGENDPRACAMPINRYLRDRLVDWREAFKGRLFVFENLMIQGCFSLPQPNTGALLEDQEIYRQIGVDGVIYETFEPGIESFVDQLGQLSRGLLGERVKHEPDELELICQSGSLAVSPRLRVLPYLFATEASDETLVRWMPSAMYAELAILLRDFLTRPIFPTWQTVVRFVMQHRERLDWIYIAYRLATYLPPAERPASLTSEQARLFSTPKPWDYLEPLPDPIRSMEQLLAPFLR